MLKIVLVAAAIGLVSSQSSLNIDELCTPDLCKGEHLACSYPQIQEKVKAGCARVVDLTDEHKRLFVDAHNEKRNLVAGGKQAGFNSATRMATMEWDQTLADLAALNVMRCEYDHDCHDTKEFGFSGQNINKVPSEDMNVIINRAMFTWYIEVYLADQSAIDSCCEQSGSNGHFTQIVTDKANKIGCAVGFMPYEGKQTSYIVCNYSYANVINRASYTSGPPASECKTGPNPQYPNLCSTTEQYELNTWTQ